jgi:hypothetical protein
MTKIEFLQHSLREMLSLIIPPIITGRLTAILIILFLEVDTFNRHFYELLAIEALLIVLIVLYFIDP